MLLQITQVVPLNNKKTTWNCCDIFKAPPKFPDLKDIIKRKFPPQYSSYYFNNEASTCKNESVSAHLNQSRLLLDSSLMANLYQLG